jgi:hypothetical protein
VVKKDWAEATLKRTLFPGAEAIPQPFAMAFMRMMMAHAKFESEVRAMQSTVANDPRFGEQPENLWSAKKRPKLMVKLIEQKLGQIPETEAIEQVLQDAFDPTKQRNHLAHGIWWAFDPQTASIHVRGGIQRKDEDPFGEYSEDAISAIASRFEGLEADLYKLRREIEKRRGDDHEFDWSPPPSTLYPYRCRDVRYGLANLTLVVTT